MPNRSIFGLVVSLALVGLLAQVTAAAELNVPSPSYPTIQSAIDAANTDDVIIVAEGTYYENIDFNGQQITLRSTNPDDPAVVANTVIDSNQSGSVVKFAGSEGPSTLLTGLTITNGMDYHGGGINGYSTGATISKCVITLNRSGGDQGQGYGGGLYACMGTIRNCVISNNRNGPLSGIPPLGAGGGGLAACMGTIINCTIVNNSTGGSGGGLDGCQGIITNCIIWNNDAPSTPQLWDCSVPSYSCIQDWTGGGDGNISDDPQFGASYHIQATSPCVDAGDPAGNYAGQTDMDGEPRVMGVRVDMGADEVWQPLWPSLVSSEPPMDTTLCRVKNNCIFLTFDQPVALIGGYELCIRAIGVPMGPDLTDSFVYSIDTDYDPSGNTLEVKENGEILTNLTWYRLEPSLLDCQPFALDLCTLIGDVNNDGLVFTTDYGFVKPRIPQFDDCAREDVNGDGLIFTTDYGYIKAHIPSFKPPKPPG